MMMIMILITAGTIIVITPKKDNSNEMWAVQINTLLKLESTLLM
jgi:hypothetical protein